MAILDELLTHFVAQSVGVEGSHLGVANSIYKSKRAIIPTGDGKIGPYMLLVETGGMESAKTHNNTATQRPSVSITVRGASYSAARTMIKAAYDACGGENGLHNVTLSGVKYLKLVPKQEPGDISSDGADRAMLGFNVDAEKQPS